MRESINVSTVTIARSQTPSVAPAASTDFSGPVSRPKTSKLGLVREMLHHGGPGYLQFAITNICNADVRFLRFRAWTGSIPSSAAA